VSLRSSARRAFEAAAILTVVALVVGAVLGQPILFGFVETGSMEPTLNPGDGFVAIPSIVAGDVGEGDVVVYRAQNLQGGGLTTHRVVGETEEGYITRGDANPFTDQDGPEPPVSDDQVVAKALTVGGTTIAIPYLGTVVMGVRGVVQGLQDVIVTFLGLEEPYGTQESGIFLVTMGVVLLVLTWLQEALTGPGRSRSRTRNRPGVIDTRRLVILLLVVVLVPANMAMILPSGTFDLAVDGDVVANSDGLEAGDPATWQYQYRNFGVVPIAYEFEAENDSVSVPDSPRVLWGRGTSSANVTMTSPPPGETAVGQIHEHRYLLVLPPGVIGALHDVDPLLALLSVNAVLAGLVILVSVRYFGFGRLRLRWSTGAALRTRLRRRFG